MLHLVWHHCAKSFTLSLQHWGIMGNIDEPLSTTQRLKTSTDPHSQYGCEDHCLVAWDVQHVPIWPFTVRKIEREMVLWTWTLIGERVHTVNPRDCFLFQRHLGMARSARVSWSCDVCLTCLVTVWDAGIIFSVSLCGEGESEGAGNEGMLCVIC